METYANVSHVAKLTVRQGSVYRYCGFSLPRAAKRHIPRIRVTTAIPPVLESTIGVSFQSQFGNSAPTAEIAVGKIPIRAGWPEAPLVIRPGELPVLY
jgi:hypothetical protein